MNFLRLVNGGGGNDSSSSSSKSRKPQRIYTPAESEVMRQTQFLLAKIDTLTLSEDRRSTMESLTSLVRDNPTLPIESSDGIRTLMQLAKSITQDRQSPTNVELSLHAVEIIKILLAPQGEQSAGAISSSTGAAADDNISANPSSTSASNTAMVSLFVQNPTYITSLLELLEEKHSVLRLYTIQCLTSLLMARTEKIQSIVLNYPMGVILLVELLSDRSEIIRNETLLLLEALTRSNQAIQKIVAFNGAFDKLLIIAAEEVHLNGGIIAEDAMRLVSALLTDNSSNQYLFLEQGCVQRLLPYLVFKEEDLAGSDDMTNNNFEFLGLTLEILNALIMCLDDTMIPINLNKNNATRNALSPLIPPLLQLTVGHPLAGENLPPQTVRYECWILLARIVDGHTRNQTILEEYKLETIVSIPATAPQHHPHHNPYALAAAASSQATLKRLRVNLLRHLLETACDSSDALERFLILHLLQSYFTRNPNGQLKAIMSFAPSPTETMRGGVRQQQQAHQNGFGGDHHAPANSPANGMTADPAGPLIGSSLLAMLAGARPHPNPAAFQPGPDGQTYVDRCRYTACRVLQYMVHENRDGQIMLLTLPLNAGDASQQQQPHTASKLIDYFIAALFTSQNHGRVELTLLSFLCEWIDGCLEVNEAIFGKYAQNLLAYLVQMSRDTNVEAQTRGLATYYLALVLELMSNPTSPSPAHTAASSSSSSNGRPSTTITSTLIPSSILLDIITKQVGLDRFKSNLSALYTSPAFTRAHGLKDTRTGNPLSVWRQEEAELDAATSSSATNGTQTEAAAAAETLRKNQQLTSLLHDTFDLSHPFTLRFAAVHDKCDQRLLNLFTSAAATPIVAQSALQHATPTTASSAALPPQHPSPHHTAAAHQHSAQVEQQLRELREENARLKQEAEVWKSSSSGSNDTMRHFQQLQYELQQVKQQLQQAQAEVETLRKSASSSTGHATVTTPSTAVTSSNAELEKLRHEHQELIAEHEDLLILLASQEQELEQARSTVAASTATPSQKNMTAVTATATTMAQTPGANGKPHGPTPSHVAASPQQAATHANGHAHEIDLR